MFHLIDSDPASPPLSHGSWKKWLAILSGFLVVIFIFLVLHDERLEPFDDLKQQAGIAPPEKDNGYLVFLSRLKTLPHVSKADRKMAHEMSDGLVPWDPGHLEKMRSGRERTGEYLDEGLALPAWMAALAEHDDSNNSANLRPLDAFHLLRLEAAGFLHDGRDAEALAGIKRLHWLATRQMDGSNNVRPYLFSLWLLSSVMDSCAAFVEQSDSDPAAMGKLAQWWEQDPPITNGFNRAMAGDAVFSESMAETIKHLASSGYPSKLKGQLAALTMKRNKTQNRVNRNLRKLIAVGMAPYPDLAAAVAAGAADGTAASPIVPAWLNFDFTGHQLEENTAYHRLISRVLLVRFDARAFRVKIALHRWQSDHGPGLPATLEELVPEYLPEVPADPWNGNPLLWDPTSGIIYSVGSDWLPDLPSTGDFEKKWFSTDWKKPGLRIARPRSAPAAAAPGE